MRLEVTPLKLMAVGFVLLMASWLVVLLMVIGQIAPSLLLSFAAYAASVAGLTVGLFGVVEYVRKHSRHEESHVGAEHHPSDR